MTVKVIPKEHLTAYQRWELGSFDTSEVTDSSTETAEPEGSEPIALPTAEEIERIHQEAWQEGYRLGLEEGHKAGYADGLKEAQLYQQRLQLLAEALDAERLRQDEKLAEELLQLALHLAQQIVRTSLKVKPSLILPALREAISALPTLNGHTRLVVHPKHVAFVRECLTSEFPHLPWKVAEDPSLDLGGFRVENAHSELDGTIALRWREILAALGADASWLD